MVLSCIDSVEVILSDWSDTGVGTTGNIQNFPNISSTAYSNEKHRHCFKLKSCLWTWLLRGRCYSQPALGTISPTRARIGGYTEIAHWENTEPHKPNTRLRGKKGITFMRMCAWELEGVD